MPRLVAASGTTSRSTTAKHSLKACRDAHCVASTAPTCDQRAFRPAHLIVGLGEQPRLHGCPSCQTIAVLLS